MKCLPKVQKHAKSFSGASFSSVFLLSLGSWGFFFFSSSFSPPTPDGDVRYDFVVLSSYSRA